MKRFKEVPAKKLKSACEPRFFNFKDTGGIKTLEGTIGQDRAVDAIEFGLNIKTAGFNLYIAGPVGTGKNSTINVFVKKIAENKPTPPDWCYVNNFKEPDRPVNISLKPGMGKIFVKDMEELLKDAKIAIRGAFKSKEYERHKNTIVTKFQAERERELSETRKKARKVGFLLQQTPVGIMTTPEKDGKPIDPKDYAKLSEGEKERIQRKDKELKNEINRVLGLIKQMERKVKEEIEKIDKDVTVFAIGHLVDELERKYRDYPKVTNYLKEVKEDIIRNTEDFKSPKREALMPMHPLQGQAPEGSPFDKYKVNLFVDNSNRKEARLGGAPVVIENNPTYYNLFGRIEYEPRVGAMVTNFSLIKPGAFHRANGGFLILQAMDVLLNYFSYDTLKRVIRNKELRIENIGEQFRTIPAVTLKPEPIPSDVKVILVGNRRIYYLLHEYDEDFRKLFKVKADFDIDMQRNEGNISKYAAFIARRCKEDGLKHFDPTGVAKVVEYGSWLTGDQQKLSTRFIDIADIISEASFWAEKDGINFVTDKEVEKAIESKEYRSNMIEEKIQELIDEGTIMIDTEDKRIGQVNGLSIYSLGDYSFGKPSRITARTYLGKAGVMNIERETEMSGKIHSKGVMILTGYIGGKYAHNKPLSVSASLCFEQLYDEVEGDSASSTELYAILSSLSDLPLKQNIAVTGSVNQRGEIQPIGGVNQKIEGFYTCCKAKGLTGDQGVIIPHQNIKNLMLKQEVIEAVRQGKFHIYPIKTIDEGIEILTGVEAGECRKDGTYKKSSVNYLVNKRLDEMAKELREFEKGE